ncbi:MAG: helicase C-terminal domain-containing protein, partial [Myxococcota bacterium]
MEHIAAAALSPEQRQLRITPKVEQDILWTLQLEPSLQSLRQRLTDAAYHLNRLADLLQELPEPFRLRDPQPLLDLNRALRRITGNATLAAEFLMSEAELVRWIEEARGRNQSPTAALCVAPVEVGPALREQVFDAMTSVITCSATMTVNRGFEHYLSRVGMQPPPERVHTQTFASPFDYRQQALLGLPQDIPDPNDRMFEAVCARFITDALHVSGGGAFVLCTSFALLRGLHRRCQAALGGRFRLLRQGEMSRSRLLNAFRADPDSVLFGTDSFWEGVSVKGNALRLVIIPRLPFRVPTEPVQQARHELLEAQGKDPFKEYSLPQAVLRFRQGFGRLIRTRTDRGAVLVLDRRTTRRWYGRVFLRSLPDLETVRAPGRVVLQRLAGLYHRPAPPAGPPPADGAVRRRVPGSSSSDDLPSGDGSR